MAIFWACEQFRTYFLSNRFQILTDHKAIISALNEYYNNKSYQSRLSRWADRLLLFDFDVVHVPGATLGTVDYMSRYPTYTTPLPSQYVELFVVKSIEAFINALNVINSSSQSERRLKSRLHPQEGVAFVAREAFLPPSHRHPPVRGVGINQNALYKFNNLIPHRKRASRYTPIELSNQIPLC